VVTHGEVLERGGRTALREAFAFLLDERPVAFG
jgi:hypothetical protein